MISTLILTVVGVIVMFDFLHWEFKVQFYNLFICSINTWVCGFILKDRKEIGCV